MYCLYRFWKECSYKILKNKFKNMLKHTFCDILTQYIIRYFKINKFKPITRLNT